VAILQALTHAHKEEHPDTIKTKCARAEVRAEKGERAEAAKELRLLLPTAERLLGPAHPETLAVYASLSSCAKAEGNAKEAVALMTHAYEVANKKLGADHVDTKGYAARLKELVGQ